MVDYSKEKKELASKQKQDFFNEKKVHNQTEKNNLLSSKLESDKELQTYSKFIKTFKPDVKAKHPGTFTFYASAEQNYIDAFYNIINFYPFDGTKEELLTWHLESSAIDSALIRQFWPGKVGHVYLDGTNYIDFYAGPESLSTREFSGKFVNGETALKIDPEKGNTVEFWLKTDSLSINKETIFQIGSAIETVETPDPDCDFHLMVDEGEGATKTRPFTLTYRTKGIGPQSLRLESSVFNSSVIADGQWHHYSLQILQIDNNLRIKLYTDGKLESTTNYDLTAELTAASISIMPSVDSHMAGRIGSPFSTGESNNLTASIDEFRYFKGARTPEQIAKFFDKKIYASDTDNVNYENFLGVKFSFNKAIEGDDAKDSIVLDYSGNDVTGRIKNYNASCRVETSAIDQSTVSINVEPKDPILDLGNQLVISLYEELSAIGKSFDKNNNNSIKSYLPEWTREEQRNVSDDADFNKLLQLLACEFDSIKMATDSIRKLSTPTYAEAFHLSDPNVENDHSIKVYSECGTETFYFGCADSGIDYEIISGNETDFAEKSFENLGLNRSLVPLLSLATPEEEVESIVSKIALEKSIYETRNLIYKCLYNTYAFTANKKGTENSYKSILNTVAAGGDVIHTNIYGTDADVFIDKNKIDSKISELRSISFQDNPQDCLFLFSEEEIDKSYIQSSQDFLGFTFEGSFGFPTNKSLTYDVTNSSVFGTHEVQPINNTLNPLSPANKASIQVSVVKENSTSNNGKFILSSRSGLINQIETPIIRNVYNDSLWNISLRVLKEGTNLFLDDNSETIYKVMLSGRSFVGQEKVASFDLEHQITKQQFEDFHNCNKTVFIGAEKENISSGNVLKSSDVKVLDFNCWREVLSDEELELRSKNLEIDGVYNLIKSRNTTSQNKTLRNLVFRMNPVSVDELNIDNTIKIVDSSISGNNIISFHGSLVGSRYNFKSTSFTNNLQNVIQAEFVGTSRNIPIINVHGTNAVQIKDSDFNKFDIDSRPNLKILSFEKSMYRSISDEMIKFLGGISFYNNAIGEPVNKYRKSYKTLDYLREMFFEGIENENQFERYVNYYRWIDKAVGYFLVQLVPASLVSNTGIENVVESHALERNKYDHKLTKFEQKDLDLSTNLLAINELLYDWEHGHFDEDENNHCLWQRDRKRKSSIREPLRQVLTTVVTGSNQGQYYNDYVLRNLIRPYKFDGQNTMQLKIGHNRNANKIQDLYKIVNTGKEIRINKDEIYDFKQCFDVIDPQKEKIYFAKTDTTDTDNYLDGDADLILPFSLYSSSVGVDFDVFKENLKITNNLDRVESVVSINPFVEIGLPHRNVKIGTQPEDRPEAYELTASSNVFVLRQTSGPKSIYTRNFSTNSFYNISNIKTMLSPYREGNYFKDYEIVMTNSRRINNNFLVENEGRGLTGSLSPSTLVSEVTDFEVPQRTARDHVIVNKFSAPGSVESSGPYGQDRESGEFSIYNTLNYRNLTVREVLNSLSSEHAYRFGYRSNPNYQSPPVALIHKTNRNYLYFSGALGQERQSDNYYVTHQIPQNDLGYSWILKSTTDSIYEFLRKNNNQGHQHKFNVSGSLSPSETLSFIQQGEYYTISGDSDEVLWLPEPVNPYAEGAPDHQTETISFAGLNRVIIDPVDSERNMLGFGFDSYTLSGTDASVPDVAQIQSSAIMINPYRFLANEFPINSSNFVGEGVTGAALLNTIILNRQGPYGWPSWKQIRGDQHPVMRSHRKNNMMSITFRGTSQANVRHLSPETNNNTPNAHIIARHVRNFKEIKATNRFRPNNYSIHITTSDDFDFIGALNEATLFDHRDTQERSFRAWRYDTFIDSIGIREDGTTIRRVDMPTFSQKLTINNDLTKFANREMHFEVGRQFDERNYFDHKNLARLNLAIETSIDAVENFSTILRELNYVEKIYPREINTFTKEVRTRENFKFFGWNSERESRKIILSGNVNYDTTSRQYGGPAGRFEKAFPIITSIKEEGEFNKSYFDYLDVVDQNHTSSVAKPENFKHITASAWVLDSRENFSEYPVNITASYMNNGVSFMDIRDQGTRSEGILQNDFSIFGLGINFLHATPPFAPIYNRRIPQAATAATSNDPQTLARYDLGKAGDVVQNKIYAYNLSTSYSPHKKLNDGTISQDTVNIGSMVQNAGGGNAVAYLSLSSQDLNTLGAEQFPTTDTINPLSAGPASPLPVQLLEASSGDIDLLTSLYPGLGNSELIFLSFTGLTLSTDQPSDWNVTGGSSDTFTNPGWLLLSSGRVETRIYRNGKAWAYKINPGDSNSFELLAEFEIPEFTLTINWDKLITSGSSSTEHITVVAKLSLTQDYTSNSSFRPAPGDDTIHLTSSTIPIVVGSTPPPNAVYATDGDAQNFINLLDPIQITTSDKILLAGESRWDAGIDHEIGPFYNSYQEFAEECRLVGQQYSIVPEFTISKFSEDVINKFAIDGQPVDEQYTKIENFLQIQGATYHESSGDLEIGTKFYKTYATSDFLKYFSDFKENVENNEFDLKPFRISFRCKAVKRFLPYRGFYPAERAVQLTEIFNRCYTNEKTYSYERNNPQGSQLGLSDEAVEHLITTRIRTSHAQAAKLLFGPGVLFNSIKSGMAVDYPVFNVDLGDFKNDVFRHGTQNNSAPIDSFDQISNNVAIGFIGTEINSTQDQGIPRLSGTVDYRADFDHFLHPHLLFEKQVYDNEPHPSASLFYGASKHFSFMDRPGIFGSMDPANTVRATAQNFERGYGLFRTAMLPYSLAAQNFAANTVDFFLKDQKLQTVMSEPVEPLMIKGVTYKMKVTLTNNNIKMYDRHSAFGPPVDDGDPFFDLYVNGDTTIPAVSARGAIYFKNLTSINDLVGDTITLEDGNSLSKEYIFTDGTTSATQSTASIDLTGASTALDGETFTLIDNNASPRTVTYRFIADDPSVPAVSSQGSITVNSTDLDGKTFTLENNESPSVSKTYRFIEDEASSSTPGAQSEGHVEFEDAQDIDLGAKSFNDDIPGATITLKNTNGAEVVYYFDTEDQSEQAELHLYFPGNTAQHALMGTEHPNKEQNQGNDAGRAPIDNQVIKLEYISSQNGTSTTTFAMKFVNEEDPGGHNSSTALGAWNTTTSGTGGVTAFKIYLKAANFSSGSGTGKSRKPSFNIMQQIEACVETQGAASGVFNASDHNSPHGYIRIAQKYEGSGGNTTVTVIGGHATTSRNWFNAANKNTTSIINANNVSFSPSIDGRWSDFHNGVDQLASGDGIPVGHPLNSQGDIFVLIDGSTLNAMNDIHEHLASEFTTAVNNSGKAITATQNVGRTGKQSRVDLEQDVVGSAGDGPITFNSNMTAALTGHSSNGTPDKQDFSGGQDGSSGSPTTYTTGQVLSSHGNQIAVALGDGTKTIDQIADEAETAIESSGGHNNTISAQSVGGGLVNLTQVTPGLSGDTAISTSHSNISKVNFTGGSDGSSGTTYSVGEVLASHSNQIAIPITGYTADQIGENAASAIKDYHAHENNHTGTGRIDASYSSATSHVSLSQEVAGASGDNTIQHTSGLNGKITGFSGGQDAGEQVSGDLDSNGKVVVSLKDSSSTSDVAIELEKAITSTNGHETTIKPTVIPERFVPSPTITADFSYTIPATLKLDQVVAGTSGNNLITGTGTFFGQTPSTDTPLYDGFKKGFDEETAGEGVELRKDYQVVNDSHGFLPYVPPYLDANTEPYAEIAFTPDRDGAHSIPEIIQNAVIKFENGIDLGTNPESVNTLNAMQLDASLSLLNHVTLKQDNVQYSSTGTGASRIKETRNPDNDRPRWVIQTRWETPVLDFKNVKCSALDLDTQTIRQVTGSPWQTRYQTDYYHFRPQSQYNLLTASTGMWHQLGEEPPAINGYTLRVSGPDQITSTEDNLASALGFTQSTNAAFITTEEPETEVENKVGVIAEEREICEAIVIIPFYQVKENSDIELIKLDKIEFQEALQINEFAKQRHHQILNMQTDPEVQKSIIQKYNDWSDNPSSGDGSRSIAYQLRMMEKFILPPHFDFLANREMVPHLQYIFQFKAKIKKEELAQLWQNLYPDTGKGIFTTQHSNVWYTEEQKTDDRETIDTEFLSSYIDVAPIAAAFQGPMTSGAPASSMEDPYEFVQNKIRWLVFKAKYRSVPTYEQLKNQSITPATENIIQKNNITLKGDGKNPKTPVLENHNQIQFNWPYDFFSLVEMADIEAKIDFYSELDETIRQRIPAEAAGTIDATGNPGTGLDVMVSDVGSPSDVRLREVELNINPSTLPLVSEYTSPLITQTAAAQAIGDISVTSGGSSDVVNQVLKLPEDSVPSPNNILKVQIDGGTKIKLGSEKILINGMVQNPGTKEDYVLDRDTNVITFAFAIEKNDKVTISYTKE